MPSYGFGWRHIIAVLAFFGSFFVYTSRVSLSIAMVAMVNQTALRISREEFYKENNLTIVKNPCHRNYNVTKDDTKDGPFMWDEEVQGLILSAFFYGYIVTQIPGGLVAGWIGGKWIFGCSVLGTVLLSLLIPTVSTLGPIYLIILRILQGLSEGAVWPAFHFLFSHWTPHSERSQLPTFASIGIQFGILSSFMLSGVLANTDFLGGWPSIFYVFGFFGCIWFVLWAVFVSNTPETHKWISNEERDYITNSVEKREKHHVRARDIPWLTILKSPAVWAVWTSHFTSNWSTYVLLTDLPIYLHDALGFDLKSNGLFSALPYLCQGLVSIASARVADYLRNRLHISTTKVRKIFDCLGHLLPAVFLVTVGYVGCNSQLALAFLILSVGLSGLLCAGFMYNFFDLAPKYSGVLFGVSNTIGTVPGMLGPFVTGVLTKGAQGADLFNAWRNVFFIGGAFYLFSCVFYSIFGKGEEQPWSKQTTKDIRIYPVPLSSRPSLA